MPFCYGGVNAYAACLGPGTLLSRSDWIRAAGFVLFIAASLLQHQSIVLLAGLRKGKSGQPVSDGV